MSDTKKGLILVGHGGIPKDYPADLVSKMKRLEAQRRAAGQPMSVEELELDTKIRTWPRTPETDPYQAGLEAKVGISAEEGGTAKASVPSTIRQAKKIPSCDRERKSEGG